jgi:type VI secretion system protein
MTITLRISKELARSSESEQQKVFDEKGGTIGRAENNDWVLHDPERIVSNHHAAIYFKNGEWYLADTSANGVFVNHAHESVGGDAPVRLNDGDSLRMGNYDVELRIDSQSAPLVEESATPAPQADFQPGAGTPEILDPLELLAGGEPQKPAMDRPTPQPVSGRDTADVTDFSRDVAGFPAKEPAAGPFLQEPRASAGAGSHPDNVGVLESGFRPPAANAQQIPEDWDLLANPRPSPDTFNAILSSGASRPASPSADEGDTVRDVAAAPAAISQDAMLRAFFEGSGLDPAECLAKADPELPRLLGEIFRELIAGMRAVLLARAEIRSGFRMNLTRIQQRENNPLKFAAGGPEEAMRHLLFHSGSSYQAPIESIREGFDDLRNHQVAVMSGMKGALLSLLRRLEPEELAEEFEPQTKSSWMPASKQARCWELYAEFYQKLLTEVEDDFQNSVGRVFTESYEAQIARLAKASKNKNDSLK